MAADAELDGPPRNLRLSFLRRTILWPLSVGEPAMQRFVHEQNLTRYFDLLESETDRSKLSQIQKLMIEEADRLGSLAERIDQADRLINDGTKRLHRQQALVEGLATDGHDVAREVAVLETLNRMLEVMAAYRRSLSDGLDRTNV